MAQKSPASSPPRPEAASAKDPLNERQRQGGTRPLTPRPFSPLRGPRSTELCRGAVTPVMPGQEPSWWVGWASALRPCVPWHGQPVALGLTSLPLAPALDSTDPNPNQPRVGPALASRGAVLGVARRCNTHYCELCPPPLFQRGTTYIIGNRGSEMSGWLHCI